MPKRITSHPSGIPASVQRDRTITRVVTVWRNYLERYAFISHRVSAKNPKRAQIEKDYTIERKALAKEIRIIENDLLRWIAECTQHPDLYTPPIDTQKKHALDPALAFSPHDSMKMRHRKERAQHRLKTRRMQEESRGFNPALLSLHARFLRIYAMNKRRSWSTLNPQYRRMEGRAHTKTRHRVAQQIMDLEWKWLSALYERVCPDAPPPPRRIVNPSRYKP
jgi:hypothetical protein